MTLKDLLRNQLNEKELDSVPSAFEIIGSKEKAVAIVEIPDSMKKRKKLIANAIMAHHKNIKSVLEKKSARGGIFRTRKYRLIAGDKNTIVMHKESGCLFKLDIRKVYFSPREGTERLRIADIIMAELLEDKLTGGKTTELRNSETIDKTAELQSKSEHETRDITEHKKKVLVFFAGIGAFPIIIEKKTGAQTTGIEINPVAIKFFRENNRLNKANALIIKGDVKKAYKTFKDYDHVIMPLPESSMKFIKQTAHCLKKGGICHLYCFAKDNKTTKSLRRTTQNDLTRMTILQSRIAIDSITKSGTDLARGKIPDLDSITTNIMKDIENTGRKCSIIHIQKVLPWGPGIYKYRIDFIVS
ncbi:MAG: methyltransferase [Candidatus Aenigmarchaeota archaeon]|nr:methyltransferase [Candidatus Aenigmarchaeota archaeon]